jgi:hypothetical protein
MFWAIAETLLVRSVVISQRGQSGLEMYFVARQGENEEAVVFHMCDGGNFGGSESAHYFWKGGIMLDDEYVVRLARTNRFN